MGSVTTGLLLMNQKILYRRILYSFCIFPYHYFQQMQKKRSVLYTVFPLVFTLLTLIAVAVGVWLWEDGKQERQADLSYTASVLQRYFELTFYQRELGLLTVGQRMLDFQDSDANDRRLEVARNALTLYNEFLAIGLAAPNGQLMTFTGDTTAGLPDLASSPLTRRSFMQTLTAKGLVIGESYYFSQVNDWIMPIRVPIRDDQGDLLAVNTSAIRYESLNEDLRSFGLNDRYRVILENNSFNTVQIYFPMESADYEQLIGKPFGLFEGYYSDVADKLNFSAFLSFEDVEIIGVKVELSQLGQALYIIVDRRILFENFWIRFRMVLAAYILLVGALIIANRFFTRKEKKYLGEIEAERDFSSGIIKGTPAIIIGIDPFGKCVFMNPGAEHTTGYRETDLLGKDWWRTIYQGDAYRQVEDLYAKMELGPVRGFEMVSNNKEGELRIISWNTLNLYSEVGELTEIVGFGNDITDLRKIQDELKEYTEELEKLVQKRTQQLESVNVELKSQNSELELNKFELEATLEDLKKTQNRLVQAEKMASLGVLSAGIGHEINNPLNFILGGVKGLTNELEKGSKSLAEKTKPFVEVINEGVGRASQIVKSLGHFSHQGGAMDDHVDLHDIVENCLVILSNKLKNHIVIKKEYGGDLPAIRGSSGKLHQVFLNVLSNAADAIKDEGEITIRSKIKSKTVEFEIQDSGIGIPKDNLSKVLDPFFTTKAPGEGTGLGLFITHSILEEHNGTLEIQSVVNDGTKIFIRLPLNIDS